MDKGSTAGNHGPEFPNHNRMKMNTNKIYGWELKLDHLI